jgi:hypothetical protein
MVKKNFTWAFCEGKQPSTTIKTKDRSMFIPGFPKAGRAAGSHVRLVGGRAASSPNIFYGDQISFPYKIASPAACTAFLDTENFTFQDTEEWLHLINYVHRTWKSDLIWCDGFATDGKYGAVWEQIRSRIIATRVIIHLTDFPIMPHQIRKLELTPCYDGAVACIARYFVNTTDMIGLERMRSKAWNLEDGIVTHKVVSGDIAYSEIDGSGLNNMGDAHLGEVNLLLPNFGDCRGPSGHEKGVHTLLQGGGRAGCELSAVAAVLKHVCVAVSKNDCDAMVHTIVSNAVIRLLQQNKEFRLFGGGESTSLRNVLGLLDKDRRLFWLRKTGNDLSVQERQNKKIMYEICFSAGVLQDDIRNLRFDYVESVGIHGRSFERRLVIDLVHGQTIYSLRLRAAPLYSALIGLALGQRSSDNSAYN